MKYTHHLTKWERLVNELRWLVLREWREHRDALGYAWGVACVVAICWGVGVR